jgi:hypothetical protein
MFFAFVKKKLHYKEAISIKFSDIYAYLVVKLVRFNSKLIPN